MTEEISNIAKTICLNMIVKNESGIILDTLKSMADYVDYYVICDTGSTDNTIELIRSFFDSKGIHGEIHEIEFKNFEYARNTALKFAQESKENFDYIFFSDADMELKVLDNKFKHCLDKDWYEVLWNRYSYLRYYTSRLLKKNACAKWIGVVHEYLKCEGTCAKLNSIYVNEDSATVRNVVEKTEMYIKLLEKGIEDEPDNERYYFYLAQSYFDIKQYKKAIEYYNKRISMGRWEEEVFYSYYRIGLSKKYLNEDESQILKAFIDCYNYRPSRAEPLYELAFYYRCLSKFPAGYMFAKAALGIPYPKSDTLFVGEDIYEFKLIDEFSVCAYWVEKYKESFEACKYLLESGKLPEDCKERVQQNLKFAADFCK